MISRSSWSQRMNCNYGCELAAATTADSRTQCQYSVTTPADSSTQCQYPDVTCISTKRLKPQRNNVEPLLQQLLLPGTISLLHGSKSSADCRDNSSIAVKMSTERWRNGTDRGNGSTGRKISCTVRGRRVPAWAMVRPVNLDVPKNNKYLLLPDKYHCASPLDSSRLVFRVSAFSTKFPNNYLWGKLFIEWNKKVDAKA
jgi:hypothetical protein